MNSRDIFSMATRNLFKRKLRTFLTVLGVVVGTGAIVIMVSLGLAVNLNVEKSMETMQDVTLINIYNWDGYYNNVAGAPVIDDDFIEYAESLDGVIVATPKMYLNLRSVVGRYSTDLQIMGLQPSAMEYLGYVPKEGRLLQDGDTLEVVFGSDVPYQYMTQRERNSDRYRGYGHFFMDPSVEVEEEKEPPINIFRDRIFVSYDWNFGQPVPPSTGDEDQPPAEGVPQQKPAKPFRITPVGWLEKGDNYEATRFAFMDIKQAKKLMEEQQKWQQSNGNRFSQKFNGYEQAIIKCKSVDDVQGVIDKVKERGFTEVYSQGESVTAMKEITQSLQMLLGSIGIVSLFVAAIGITNTMIMAIYERTREIGVMKVIGAALKDIRKLFLTEAAMIGLIGGFFGVLISYIVAYILNNVQGIAFLEAFSFGSEDTQVSYIPIWLSASALGFASLIGLISGYFPARRAMKLSALSAIRSE